MTTDAGHNPLSSTSIPSQSTSSINVSKPSKSFMVDSRSPISQQILHSPRTLQALADSQYSNYVKLGLDHGTGNLKCEICFAHYDDQRHLKHHWTVIHGCNPVSCKTCRRPFSSEFLLHQHILEIHGHKCPLCHILVVSESALRSHVSNVHQTILEFQCTLCGDSFTSISGLTNHLDAVHRNPVDGSSVLHKCPNCNRIYLTEIDLSGHVLSHDQTIFCGICGGGFDREHQLKRHLFTTHKKMREPPI